MTIDPPTPPAASIATGDVAERVFAEPWEARAFAITLALHQAGLFSWKEWATKLGVEIGKAACAGDANTSEAYYQRWLAALETMITEKGIADATVLALYREAWNSACERTPHGSPIELCPGDFAD